MKKKSLQQKYVNFGTLFNFWSLFLHLYKSTDFNNSAAAAKSLQSCLTLCDPIDGSPPGSTIPGILQAKNTGVGCHFLLQCMKVKGERSRLVMSDSLQPHGLQPTRLLRLWASPAKSTGVGCHCLLHIMP